MVGTCDTPGSGYFVAVSGTTAYVADGSSGLQVIDVSVPTAPVVRGTCATSDSAEGPGAPLSLTERVPEFTATQRRQLGL